MSKIYYLGYYDINENKTENRNIVLSCANKMTYIIEAIEQSEHCVEVVSAAQTKNACGYDEKYINICKNSVLHLFKTLPWGNKIRRILSILHMQRQYQNYLLKALTPNDTLIAYHSVAYANFLAKAKRKIGFKLILEVEEIYADVSERENDRKKEYNVFAAADAFIFPSKLLNEKLNLSGKPFAITHGTYKVEPDRKVRFNDDKIHIIYAGTFEPKKGGAIASIQSAEYLSEKYHLHVLGFGSESEKAAVVSEVERINAISQSTVSFDGLLSGENYIQFLQSCDIGLSTQNPEGDYNDTSFPSKILSYMANGLRVVCVDIPAVRTSGIGEYMYYYNTQTPEEIANAIKSIDLSYKYDSRSVIQSLDKEFCAKLSEILK